MKQYPSKLRFKKYHRPKKSFQSLVDNKNFFPKNSYYGLKALSSGKITFKQIEAGRRTIRRAISKKSKIRINIFTSFSKTKKPVSSRMGKGKGEHYLWFAPVKKGKVIFEVECSDYTVLWKALSQAGSKLPFKTKIVSVIY